MLQLDNHAATGQANLPSKSLGVNKPPGDSMVCPPPLTAPPVACPDAACYMYLRRSTRVEVPGWLENSPKQS
eukprot:scaffold50862_cov65-Phaeocystis_antarctica.AAC.1